VTTSNPGTQTVPLTPGHIESVDLIGSEVPGTGGVSGVGKVKFRPLLVTQAACARSLLANLELFISTTGVVKFSALSCI
jgi:hypothetical protein